MAGGSMGILRPRNNRIVVAGLRSCAEKEMGAQSVVMASFNS